MIENCVFEGMADDGMNFYAPPSIIGGFRGRGVLARAHHGLIENNLIRETSGQGISICNEPDWPEGPIPSNLTIRNNTLVGVLRDSNQQHISAIHISAYKLRFGVADKPCFRNVIIENNRIIDPPGRVIILQGVSDAVIRNNLVQLTANQRSIKEYFGIKLDNCENITIEDFTMSDQWSRITSAVSLKGTSKKSVSISNIHADLNAKGQLIKQQQ